MGIKHKIAEYFGLIDSYKRIVELERILISLTDRVTKIEQEIGMKDSYIESVIKKGK